MRVHRRRGADIDFISKDGKEWLAINASRMKLLHIPHRSMRHRRYELSVELTETKLKPTERGNLMRCLFETKLSVDIDVNDDALRKAFIDMILNAARAMYGPTVMLAKNPPTISVSMASRNGKMELPLFEVTQESDDEEED